MKNITTRIKEIYPVSDEALEALLSCMREEIYPKHTIIVRSGSVDHNVYFIEEGITRSFFLHDGTETTTWFSEEGDITFGMGSLYYNQPSAESVETLERCKIYVIPISRLNELYENYIDIANWGRIVHQHGYNNLTHIFVDRLQLSPKERYDRFMKYFPRLINRVKLKYVAAFLGISIYTLSRIRSQKI
ncbi:MULTISPECIES: Crp/Fnr family transcriptional regulator [Parabacteroides]|uniref:CRP-like cAMP-binding protein n=1 Tax=Parabacteroides faecis TaxID=1217282 RepID=A0ABR6KJM0_9BACT|nr:MULTISPECIES: cyclic nucleotide-binding domain-containing protein [Parabacteroides]MBB4621692.1 CRP-like cAMP-binding protein [Parabacteroides faecis]RHR43144.1 cyclic nucleotide-binding domain-containing protein [Parabacteroides sp. AF18-52]